MATGGQDYLQAVNGGRNRSGTAVPSRMFVGGMSSKATGGQDESQAANGDLTRSGIVVPNGIFVGGISSKTNEEDLRNLFSKYGNVKTTKIIVDKAGISKGYGFVTFETIEEAQQVLLEGYCLTLKDRKLNIAAAVKKHPYSRNRESSPIHGSPVVWPLPYSGFAGLQRGEPYYPQVNVPQASWPLVYPQQLWQLPQQCVYPQIPQPGYPHYVCCVAPVDYQYPGGGQVAGSDFSESSSADSGDNGKNRSRVPTPAPICTEYDRNRSTQLKSVYDQNAGPQKFNGSDLQSPSAYMHSSPAPQMHHVLTKTLNGVAVMAYPAPFVMGSTTLGHMRDGNADSENLFEFGYVNSPIASGALTPPPTPITSMACDFGANTSMESSRKS